VVSNQIALLVVNILANRREGDFSDYTYAFVFFQLPHGLLAVSLMTTFMPDMARLASAGNWPGFIRRFALGIRVLVFVVGPAALGLVLVSRSLVAGLLVRGQFTEADALRTGDILALMALGLVGFSTYLFTIQAFYCLKDTRTPFRLNALENALNIAFGVALYPSLGIQGLGLAYALAYDISAIVALIALRRRVGGLGGAHTARSVGISLTAAGTMLGLALLLLGRSGDTGTGLHALLVTGLAVLLGVVLYAAASLAFVVAGPRFDQRRLLRGHSE
jgi:putative peptidoglycan lipid II flippase